MSYETLGITPAVKELATDAFSADILTTDNQEDILDYIAQFLAGIARSAGDAEMVEAAESLAQHRDQGLPYGSDVARIAGLVHARIEPRRAV